MTAPVTKVTFKPDQKNSSQYVCVGVHPEEYKKWKEGDTTIRLADLIDAFDVYHSNTGHQGILGKASNQQMETDFGTKKVEEVIKIILEKGKITASEGISGSGQPSTNLSRGSRIPQGAGGNVGK